MDLYCYLIIFFNGLVLSDLGVNVKLLNTGLLFLIRILNGVFFIIVTSV